MKLICTVRNCRFEGDARGDSAEGYDAAVVGAYVTVIFKCADQDHDGTIWALMARAVFCLYVTITSLSYGDYKGIRLLVVQVSI